MRTRLQPQIELIKKYKAILCIVLTQKKTKTNMFADDTILLIENRNQSRKTFMVEEIYTTHQLLE